MDYRYELIQMGKNMKEKSAFLHKRLRSMPKGTLQVALDKNWIRYNQLVYSNGHLTKYGIKTRPDLVKSLFNKAYITEYTERLDNNILILRDAVAKMNLLDEKNILDSLPENYSLLPKEYIGNWLPSSMHPVFTDAIPVREAQLYIPEEEIDIWATRPYRANSFNMNLKRYKTIDGIKMRSKSEIAILDIYKANGIAVHYDELLLFNGTRLSPDFIAVRYDGKVIIHEHCGMVNDKEYMNEHKRKLQIYEAFGFVPWDNLIITYDTADGGLDLKLIEAEILSKLMP